ncbi:pumilio homolog 5 isoform X2 [Momordica charantia]|uniref:Pumilio homolog 5 isoform X2 n=1 Tax=Momordica charantia TaxID=3673 RepID=A0A6J1D3B4_MOMCH|nr:pumilio homolog 5 isoform X2 [Momordica charantia]
MATESPTRIVDRLGDRNWSATKDIAAFGSPFENIASEELGSILEMHNFSRNLSDLIPNRSGSAPPNMEGSFAAIGNLLTQQDSSLVTSLSTLCDALENCMSEEQLRSHPAYFEYYCSNVNLNPRLPPPLISRENRRLVRHIGGLSKNRRVSFSDDTANEFLLISQGSLSTHQEETPEDGLLKQVSENLTERNSTALPTQNISFTTSHRKSLVDLIQEDFPRTPSPVYNQSLLTSRSTTEQAAESDLDTIASCVSSISISKVLESSSCSSDVCLETSNVVRDPMGLISNDALLKKSPKIEKSDRTRSQQQEESRGKSVCVENIAAKTGTIGHDIPKLESRTKASIVESNRNKLNQQSYGRNHPYIYLSKQQGFPSPPSDIQSQMVSQGISHQEVGLENYSHGQHNFSTAEVQTVFHSSALTPPLYATAAAYMAPGNPFYHNYQPSGLFSPQFNVGGYAMASTVFPPFMAGYPSHGAVPLPEPSGSNFSGRNAGVSIGESIPPVGDIQHLSKLYAQPGFIYPPFVDPMHVHYGQRIIEEPYGSSAHHGQLASRNFSQMPINSFVSQQDSNVAAYLGDNEIQSPKNGSFNISSLRKGVTGGNYGDSSSMSGIMQFSVPSIASPASPSSPVGGVNHLGQRNEMWFPPGLVRNAGAYSGWQGQRGSNNFDDPKRHSFLEELKSSNARKFELSDIAGRIIEFSVDQHGSRFIQQKLEHCSSEEKASVFKEVLPHASKLMTDVFGNYVIQKFFEHGTHEQRKELADQLAGQMVPLSLQMYGCRVIQKALEVIELDQKTQLIHELDGHVMRCVRDQNGNHVIQKCIECVPSEEIGFIISSFGGQVATLSTHPYGCRVIQRILEHCSDEAQSQCIVDEILDSVYVLAQDQYGNYVIQHVLERGMRHERSQIISKMTGKFVRMSQHKYASNVVEKCLEHGDMTERELMIEEIMGQSEENDTLLTMMKDQFANYVIQKIIEICNDEQREMLLNRIRGHLQALKKYTYGKHIVARLEQLSGEGNA